MPDTPDLSAHLVILVNVFTSIFRYLIEKLNFDDSICEKDRINWYLVIYVIAERLSSLIVWYFNICWNEITEEIII